MNLIDQLGGYEKAKEWYDENTDKEWVGIYHMPKLYLALLEHRREHNIFEVGDKVVYKPSMVQGVIFTVIGSDDFEWMKTEAFFEGFDHPKRFSEDPPFSDVRHATDEEIKAGRRL